MVLNLKNKQNKPVIYKWCKSFYYLVKDNQVVLLSPQNIFILKNGWNIHLARLVPSKSPETPRSQTDLKRRYLHTQYVYQPHAPNSDGVHANTFSLTATVKMSF